MRREKGCFNGCCCYSLCRHYIFFLNACTWIRIMVILSYLSFSGVGFSIWATNDSTVCPVLSYFTVSMATLCLLSGLALLITSIYYYVTLEHLSSNGGWFGVFGCLLVAMWIYCIVGWAQSDQMVQTSIDGYTVVDDGPCKGNTGLYGYCIASFSILFVSLCVYCASVGCGNICNVDCIEIPVPFDQTDSTSIIAAARCEFNTSSIPSTTTQLGHQLAQKVVNHWHTHHPTYPTLSLVHSLF